jgi:hypothetical protein
MYHGEAHRVASDSGRRDRQLARRVVDREPFGFAKIGIASTKRLQGWPR